MAVPVPNVLRISGREDAWPTKTPHSIAARMPCTVCGGSRRIPLPNAVKLNHFGPMTARRQSSRAAATAAATTTTSGWASDIALPQAGPFLESLSPLSAAAQLIASGQQINLRGTDGIWRSRNARRPFPRAT